MAAALAADFEAQGFVAIPGVLSPAQVERARACLEADRRSRPESWQLYGRSRDGGPVGESGRWQQHTLLADSREFDWVFNCVLQHPLVLPLVQAIAGQDACLSGMFSRFRDPVLDPPPPQEQREEGSTGEPGVHWRMWHREQGGRCLPTQPYFMHSLQLALELDANRPDGHCLSIVPESLEAKRALKWTVAGEDVQGVRYQIVEPFIEKMWRNNNRRPDGVDMLCEAGTLIFFNNSNVHAGTVRQTPRPRRTLGFHFYPELRAQLGAAVRHHDNAGTSGGPVGVLERGVGRFVDDYPELLRWVPTVVYQLRTAQAEAEARGGATGAVQAKL
jgi:ectoine hydroxylase-related dioxygenase (phytanoyl-CoA dioxygenase family)